MIETIFAFLILPWVWILGSTVILMLALANDSKLFAGVFTGFMAFLVIKTNWGSIDWAYTATAVGCYVAVGLVFSFVKWWFFTRKSGREFQEFCKNSKLETNDQIAHDWNSSFRYRGFFRVKFKDGVWDPEYDVADLSTRVFFWTVYWPIHALLILFEDFLKELARAFVEMFGGVYRRMAKAAFNAG